ncbi:MAG: ABC transporter permease subunit [Anaerolineales bacterium]|nr:ABC transporter permease subunit [Anaerolineales bacterium]
MSEAVRWDQPAFTGAWIIAKREIKDQVRDWRILSPIIILTLFFPVLMNFTAQQAVDFVGRYGAPIIGDRLIPFLLMVVGFFPISISLVIALESFAGERERQSLEPLLATPLTDGQLYLGKMLSSLALPITAAFIGIIVYLTGLFIRLGWTPPPQLLLQVILLTTVQAVVMVSGAVVISSQATSVRAANLLASFIILPIAQLIIVESLIMFWGRYDVLWLIVLALFLISLVLSRMGLHLFHRENMLGREIDVLNLRWLSKEFKSGFFRGTTNPWQWYKGIFKYSIPRLRYPILVTAILLIASYFIGFFLAERFRLPEELLQFNKIDDNFLSQLSSFGFMSFRGWTWIVMNNLRAILLASFFGIFSFGILGELLLMMPIAIIGYFGGSLQLAGQDVSRVLVALVLPHAVLEVPAALLAGAAILQLGMVMMSPARGASLGESWVRSLAEWARITFGLVFPLLVLAALIETFLTPVIALLLLSG